MTITKLISWKLHSRRHALAHPKTLRGRPLCGGGNGAKEAAWQIDTGPVDCARCLAIQVRRERAIQEVMAL